VQGGHHERGTVDADKIAFVVIDVPQATETLDADVARFTDAAGLDYKIVTIPPGTADMTSQMQEVAASGADVVQVVSTPRGCRARLGVTRRPDICRPTPSAVRAGCTQPALRAHRVTTRHLTLERWQSGRMHSP
jgi:Periplasmic binding protein